jgi:hypothetical protein
MFCTDLAEHYERADLSLAVCNMLGINFIAPELRTWCL